MSNSLFGTSPVFIPKIMDASLVESDIKLPAVIINANHILWRPKVPSAIRAITDNVVINPVTYYLEYPTAGGKNFSDLPYGEEIEVETLYSNASSRKSLIEKSLNFQIDNGATVLIAPYLFADEIDSTGFSLNLTLLAETLRYKEEISRDIPLYAVIPVGANELIRLSRVNFLVDRYQDDFKGKVDGYFVVVNDCDDRKADLEVLTGLAKLVFQLSRDTEVYVKRIGGFGEVLCAVGASGFSSGVGMSETFSLKNLQEENPFRRARSNEVMYVPEIFDYANVSELKKIGYTCACPACNGGYAFDLAAKRRHFLYSRLARLETFKNKDNQERIDIMSRRLLDAIRYATSCRQKYASPFETTHLLKWKSVIDSARDWNWDKDDTELIALLTEIDNS